MKFQVKREGKLTLLGLGLAVLIATAIAAVPGIFSYVNSTNGYKVAGAAGSNGQVLGSNGTYYNTPVSLYNQLIESSGSALTKEPTLNLQNGTNTTVLCADNPGLSRTDCQINAAGATGPTETCNANGCYWQLSDGTYHAWGISSTATGGTSNQVLTITYPVTFVSAPDPTVSSVAAPAGGGGPCTGFSCPVSCNTVRGTQSTTGVSVAIFIPTQVGGSGFSGLSAGDYCKWEADGK